MGPLPLPRRLANSASFNGKIIFKPEIQLVENYPFTPKDLVLFIKWIWSDNFTLIN